MQFLLATSNPHKAAAFQAVLTRQVDHIHIELPELQAVDVKEVIEHKARAAYRLVGKPVLVEDTGLSFHAWNGLPGALIRWFLETVGNNGICKMLEGYAQLDATAETCLGYFDGAEFRSFSGFVQGTIARTPRGAGGFGWDPIFIPNGWPKTFAEMTEAESASISMRRIALSKLRAYLDANNA
jgi:non-canonical purine NTP pyrophosphatase (RdgB/HAM1 family)